MKFIKLLNVLNNFLYKYKYRSSVNPYLEINKLTSDLSFKKNLNKKILIVPFRVSSVSNLFEGNCSLIFRSKGYDVDFLLCGQSVKHCEQIDFSKSKFLRCNLCFHEQRKFTSSYKGNAIFVNEYVTVEELNQIQKDIDKINLKQLEDLNYRNVPIYKPLVAALQLYLKQSSFCPIKDKKLIKSYLYTIYVTINALDNYFLKNRVEIVLLSHGVYSTWGAVMMYCQARSIKCVTWGREYHGAGIVAAHNDSYLKEPMEEINSSWNHQPLTSRQSQQIIDYLSAKVGQNPQTYDYVNYYNSGLNFLTKVDLCNRLGIAYHKKIIALLPNIPWDGQIFRPATIFDSIDTWLFETIDWFKRRDDCVLVIRTHPAEKHAHGGNGDGLLGVLEANYGKNGLPKNVYIIPADSKIKSIAVAANSCAALLYASTIGYETTFLKIPTILASKFFYSDKDITFDPKTKEKYFHLIQQALDGNLIVDNARHMRLLQYAYHYNFRRVMPETLMNLKGLNFNGYLYQDIQKILHDETINKFINYCISGERFYFDECYG